MRASSARWSRCDRRDDPEPLIAFGRWDGEILHAPRGDGGFGYDPLMFIPPLGRTVAELTADVKNAHSHRALAAQQMLTSDARGLAPWLNATRVHCLAARQRSALRPDALPAAVAVRAPAAVA